MAQKIALTMSGGGFRATLFHLGVVLYLQQAGLLSLVHRICSVSGGSILAAHLVLNWEQYLGGNTVNKMVRDIIHFTRRDVRGRVIRRWLLSWATIIPRLLSSRYTRINLLRAEYGCLYSGKRLYDLSVSDGVKRPALYLLATSMTSGQLWAFHSSGISILKDRVTLEHIAAESLDVALAVAASSAFPPLFPPLRVGKADLGLLQREYYDQFLTDGGVYDNLGVSMLHSLEKSESEKSDWVIVSDASGVFDSSLTYPIEH